MVSKAVAEERARRAVKAMEPLGFSRKLISDVLRRLFKLYGTWEPIEEDNYKILADAILDAQLENDNEEAGGRSQVAHEQSTPPTNNGTCVPGSSSSKRPIIEDEEELDQGEPEKGGGLVRKRLRRLSTAQPQSEEHNKAIVLAPVPSLYRDSPMNGPKIEPGKRDEASTDDMPLAMIFPESISSENLGSRLGKDKDKEEEARPPVPDQNGTKLDIGSSPTGTALDVGSSSDGQIKISFLFPTPNPNPNIPFPNLNDFFKMAEDRCLKSFKILPPDFSLPNILNEMCQLVAEQFELAQSNVTNNATITETINETNLRPAHDINDICRGMERLAVPIMNEYNSDKCPSHFTYMCTNLPYQTACLNFSLGGIRNENCCADCFGDCLSSPVPCACARGTGGEYRYTQEGLLRTAFLDHCFVGTKNKLGFCQDSCKFESGSIKCKGHLQKRFVKECWVMCGCSTQCENRVVQRGLMCRLQVFMTGDGRGWGLRALDEIPRGSFVCEYVGEVLTTSELNKRFQDKREDYFAKDFMNIVKLDANVGVGPNKDGESEGLHLDPTFCGNIARFINHRCNDANLVEVPVEIESPDRHYYHLALFTSRKVEALEELTWDYGIDFKESENSRKGFRCKCGSKYCRNVQRTRKAGLKN